MRQLSMIYNGGVLPFPPAKGFSIRTYDESFREQLKDALISLTIERYSDAQLEEVILKRPGVHFEGVFMAEDDNCIIGTATGYTHFDGDNGGTLHMVSVLPTAKGRGVGMAVCASAVNYLINSGCSYVDLTTDDFRKSAIVIYTRLGFRPVIDDDEMLERWNRLADELNMPELISEAIRK